MADKIIIANADSLDLRTIIGEMSELDIASALIREDDEDNICLNTLLNVLFEYDPSRFYPFLSKRGYVK